NAGRFEKLLSAAEMSNLLIISMAKTSDGRVWMGTRDAGLFVMNEGQISAVTKGLPDKKINSVLPVDNQELWIGTDNGVVRCNGDTCTKAGVSGSLDHIQALSMMRDHQANIWIGTSNGLLRVNDSGVAALDVGDLKSPGAVNCIFEDREGNLW